MVASGLGRPTGRLKAGFGLAEVGVSAMEVMVQVYLLELYIRAGLNPVAAGAALAIAAVWDAVSDPLMGSISDRTSAATAVGKRLPYMVAGALLSGIALAGLFSPALDLGQLALFSRLLGWYLVLNTALTLVGVPYLALINDLAKASADRAGFFGWRLVASGAGLMLALSLPSLLPDAAALPADEASSKSLLDNRRLAAFWIGSIGLLSIVGTVAIVWRAASRAKVEKVAPGVLGLLAFARSAISSRMFLYVVAAFVAFSIGRAANASLALLFYKGTLRFDDGEVALALLALSISIMVATPIWILLARRFSKGRLCLAGSVGLTAITAAAYPLLPVGQIAPVVFVAVLGGAVVASVALLESLFSDIVQRRGRDRAASYYGWWRMATKLARAVGLAVSGAFLGAIGYREGVEVQSAGVDRAVAWAFGPGVALFFGLGAWFIWLAARRSEEADWIQEGER